MISVIVPVYKVEPYICQCVNSILNQTYRDLEVLLIDDGSPDKCGEICDEYEKKDQRVRVFHTENRGLSAARNLGLKEARGEYIGFVDSDDWIEPDMYEVLLKIIEEKRTDISVCGLWYEYPTCTEAVTNLHDEVYQKDDALVALILGYLKNYAWNKLYSKRIWKNIAFPEGHVFEDVATIYKVVKAAKQVATTSVSFYHYRQRENSIASARTMINLRDYWEAYFGRYSALVEYSACRNNAECLKKLNEQVVNSAARTWRWIYGIPRSQWDEKFIWTVSAFVRSHYPIFGKRAWKPYLRLYSLLTRYTCELSLFVGYFMNQIYRSIGKKNVLFP